MCTYPVQPVCTSLSSLLFILLFIKSQHTVFAHLICFAPFILLHILLFILFFLPIYIYIYIYIYLCSCVVFILLNFYFYYFGPDLIYISLLIIPCIMYYVTNKETLNLDLEQECKIKCYHFDRAHHKASGFEGILRNHFSLWMTVAFVT